MIKILTYFFSETLLTDEFDAIFAERFSLIPPILFNIKKYAYDETNRITSKSKRKRFCVIS
jgi:hypothetical protein